MLADPADTLGKFQPRRVYMGIDVQRQLRKLLI
jgi:hypothetical protein